MTPERFVELRHRAGRLASDMRWLADEFLYFAENATDEQTAKDLMKWLPVRVWTLLTDQNSAKKQCSKQGPLSLTVTKPAADEPTQRL
jgi:hypothetical protein